MPPLPSPFAPTGGLFPTFVEGMVTTGSGGVGATLLASPKALPLPLPPLNPKALPLPFPGAARAGECTNAIAAPAHSSARVLPAPQAVRPWCPSLITAPFNSVTRTSTAPTGDTQPNRETAREASDLR